MEKHFVYRFLHNGEVIYVCKAKTDSLADKLINHRNHDGKLKKYCKEYGIEFSDLTLEYLEYVDDFEADLVKTALMYLYRPVLNACGNSEREPESSVSFVLHREFQLFELKNLEKVEEVT